MKNLHIELVDGWHSYPLIEIEDTNIGPPGRFAIVKGTIEDLKLYMEDDWEDEDVDWVEDWFKDGKLWIALDEDKAFEEKDGDLWEIDEEIRNKEIKLLQEMRPGAWRRFRNARLGRNLPGSPSADERRKEYLALVANLQKLRE